MDDLRTRTIIIGDQPVRFYEHVGENRFFPSIIFLHGWRSSSSAWGPTLRFFKDAGFSFYLIDLPGFGGSDTPARPFSIDDYAALVEAFIERLGLLSVILIGHSFGGRIGIKISSRKGNKIDKLVLVDAAGIRRKKGTSWKKIVAKIVKPIFTLFPLESLRRRIYVRLGAEDYLATPELKQTFVNIIEENLEPLLPRITCPTLIIWGERDNETPLSMAYTMEREISNSELVVFEGVGHMSFVEKPEQFGRDVVEFAKQKHNEDES